MFNLLYMSDYALSIRCIIIYWEESWAVKLKIDRSESCTLSLKGSTKIFIHFVTNWFRSFHTQLCVYLAKCLLQDWRGGGGYWYCCWYHTLLPFYDEKYPHFEKFVYCMLRSTFNCATWNGHLIKKSSIPPLSWDSLSFSPAYQN